MKQSARKEASTGSDLYVIEIPGTAGEAVCKSLRSRGRELESGAGTDVERGLEELVNLLTVDTGSATCKNLEGFTRLAYMNMSALRSQTCTMEGPDSISNYRCIRKLGKTCLRDASAMYLASKPT